jgi:hypothetical protein
MAPDEASRRTHRVLATLAVMHSMAVLAIWLLAERSGGSLLVRPGVWVTFAWLWLAWPIVLTAHPGRSVVRVAVPVGLSVLLLAPCVEMVMTLTSWIVGGFAP